MVTEKRKKDSETDMLKLLNFFEEFSWFLESNKDINFKNSSKVWEQMRNLMAHNNGKVYQEGQTYRLIGVLPSLLKDTELFQTNAQLVKFAEEVLSLSITRWEKRSRNELIGLIICEVEDANKQRLDQLTKWTENISKHKNQVQDMQAKATKYGSPFSWNETIQKITGDSNE